MKILSRASLNAPWVAFVTLLILVTGPASAQRGALLEKDQHIPQRFERAMVVSGEPIASKVGATILARGGNAVDSATAVAFALAVTLPRAGNIGGGGFSLILDASGQVHALDFRETAPAALHREFYLDKAHSSRQGPTASGVPGTVMGLWMMHQKFGVLPWPEVVEPAIRLADEGFPVSSWESEGLQSSRDMLSRFPAAREVFFPAGQVPPIGARLVQKDLGRTLKRVARFGPKDFYHGETAKLLVSGLREAGGVMSLEDLANYRAVWRKPVQGDFRGVTVWSMPPPSSGGVHLLQMLELVEDHQFSPGQHNSAAHLHLLTEAMRLAYCDRAKYLGDPDFVEVPLEKLLSEPYLEERKKLLPMERAGDSEALAPELFQKPEKESEQTTHFNVVDEKGMAVSLTYTLNFSYGSGFMAPGTGFLLNNEMDDFNAQPGAPNAYGLIGSAANDVQAGKRPLSSMTPTLLTKEGKFFAAVGAPGGSRIINGVFESIVNLLGFGLNAQTAVAMPRIHHQWFPDQIDFEFGITEDTRKVLQAMGHDCQPIYAVAHVLAIVKNEAGYLEAGLDPRRPASAEGY